MDLGRFFKEIGIGILITLFGIVLLVGGIFLLKDGNKIGILCIVLSIPMFIFSVIQIVAQFTGKSFLIR